MAEAGTDSSGGTQSSGSGATASEKGTSTSTEEYKKTDGDQVKSPVTIGNVRNDTANSAENANAAHHAALSSFRQRFFAFRPLPWWVMLIVTVYLFSDIRWRLNESPCSILGISDPVTGSVIKKTFRTLSLCTHPDRLRGKLKRAPTDQESVTGQVLFNRFTEARDTLMKHLDDKEKRREIRRERKNKKRKKEGLPPLEEEYRLLARFLVNISILCMASASKYMHHSHERYGHNPCPPIQYFSKQRKPCTNRDEMQ